MTSSTVEFCDGFAPIANQFDGFILDLWGVIHNGVEAFPWAVECMAEIRKLDRPVTILSNAPRRVPTVIAKLRELGIDDDLYDHVLTSGEESWLSMKNRTDVWYSRLGNVAYHMGQGGPDKDSDMRQELNNTTFTEDLNEAEFILLTGTTDASHQISDYEKELQQAAARKLPMICANPDLVVVRGNNCEICAGALAEHYESLGGTVKYHGKPYESVYRTCCELMDLPMDAKVVGVGDSLKTDVHGAKNAGLTSAFIAGGIYAEPMEIEPGEMPTREAFDKTASAYEHLPNFVMPYFSW